MNRYMYTDEDSTFFRIYPDLATAEAYEELLVGDYTVSLAESDIESTDAAKLLLIDENKGRELVQMYLLDNRIRGPFDPTESSAILLALNEIMQFLKAGSISQARDKLQAMIPDGTALTAEIKTKYLDIMNDYLSQRF